MSGRPAPRRPLTARAEARERTRELLLDVSLRLFVRRGYAGTTVRDIADAATVLAATAAAADPVTRTTSSTIQVARRGDGDRSVGMVRNRRGSGSSGDTAPRTLTGARMIGKVVDEG